MFERYLNGNPITEDSISSFLLSCKVGPSSFNAYSSRIKRYLKWAKQDIHCPTSKTPKSLPKALEPSDLNALLCRLESPTRQVAVLLSNTALRWSEMASLTSKNLFFHKEVPFLQIYGKMTKERIIPLNQQAYEAFLDLTQNYLPMRPGVQSKVRKDLKYAGISAKLLYEVKPHLLRATFISDLINNQNIDSTRVAALVGHSNVSTLKNYYYKPTVENLSQLTERVYR